RVDAHPTALALTHLPELDKDDGALIAKGLMRRARRIAHIPACRVVFASLGEGARQHEDLLTTRVLMAWEAGARRVPHNAGRSRFLATQAIQHHALHTCLG